MVYGIYQSAAGLQVNQYRQDVLANNLANVGTVGFKPDLALVRERMVASREGALDPTLSNPILDRMTGGTGVAPMYTSFIPGTVEHTGQALDVALQGDGFFAVQDGETKRYTRDGRFTFDVDGNLVTVAGHRPVLDESGAPITLPAGAAAQAKITQDGTVQAGDTSYAQIGVFDFADKQQLRKYGSNLLDAGGAKPQAVTASLMSEAIETSAVDPTQTMVAMIEASRAYQLNATLIGLADSTLGRAVNDIARIR